MRRVVYLSGRIDGLSYVEAAAQRNLAADLLLAAGWDVLDPLRGKEGQQDSPKLDAAAVAALGLSGRALIDRDLDDIRRSNLLLYLTANDLSWGSMLEVAYASMVTNTPVVAVGQSASPWANHFVAKFCPSVEAACEFIIGYFDRGYRLEDPDSYAAYVAGLVDADGCISVHKAAGKKKASFPMPCYRPTLSVINSSETAIHLLRGRFGGTIESRGVSPLGTKPLFAWRAEGRSFRQAARAIMPFLSIKQEQLRLAYSLSLAQEERGGRNRTADEAAWEQAIANQVSALNSNKGKRAVGKKEEVPPHKHEYEVGAVFDDGGYPSIDRIGQSVEDTVVR